METVVIKFVADTAGLQPAIEQLEILGKISKADAAAFARVNDEQKQFIQNLNKSTTEMGKLSTEVDGLMSEIQAGIMEGFADHLAEVTANGKQAATGFKSMKQELKELKAQIASGSLGAKELKEATKRAAELQDTIGDVNDKVKALASDTKRIDAVVTAFRGVAAAASVAAGAAALLGDENEELTKTLAKAQGAMALLQGVQELANIATTEGALRTYLLDGAQKLAAISSKALGTTIAASTAVATAGLSLLIAGLAYLVITMDDVTERAVDMNKALSDDAGEREKALEKRYKLLREGVDKELLINKQAHDKEINRLNKAFRDKTLSQTAYQNAVAVEDDLFLSQQQAIRDKYSQLELDKDKASREKLAKQRKDFNDKALQQQLLQIRDEIAHWELMIRSTTSVDEKVAYHQKITDLRKKQIEVDGKLTANELTLQKAFLDEQQRVYEESFNKRSDADIDSWLDAQDVKMDMSMDWWLLYFALEDAYYAKLAEKRKQDAKMWASFAIDQAQVVSDTIFQINAQNRQAETNMILDSLNERMDAELSNQELTDAQRIQIEKRYRLQEANIKRQAWEAEKQAALAQASINTALAVTKAWATVIPPFNIPAAIAAGVAGAAQIAIIANTKPPKFEKGGMVDGNLHTSGGTLIEAERGEFVVNRHATAEYLPVLKAINNNEPTFAGNILAALANGTFDLAAQFQSKAKQTESEFDYVKLSKVMERNKSTLNINIDEQGFTKRLERTNSKTSFRNAKLRLKI